MKRSATTTKMKRGTPVPASGMAPPDVPSDDSLDFDDHSSSPPLSEQEDSFSFREHRDGLAASASSYPLEPPSFVDSVPSLNDDGSAIVRRIASFLSVSDAASLASMERQGSEPLPEYAHGDAGDWAVGAEIPSWTSLATPATPGLIALSPVEACDSDDEQEDSQDLVSEPHDGDTSSDGGMSSSSSSRDWGDQVIQRRLQQQRKKWCQQKLTAAVFSHPQSVRSYCLEAHNAALEIQRARQEQFDMKRDQADNPETLREPPEPRNPPRTRRSRRRRTRKDRRLRVLHMLLDTILSNVPLSVLLDLAEASAETGLDTSFSVVRISFTSINAVVSGLAWFVQLLWDGVVNFNPFTALDAMISMQFNAMGRTSEALASGIQSVATGVGSASNLAIQRLSRSGGDKISSSSLAGKSRRVRGGPVNDILTQKLLRKLSDINDAAQVVAYMEEDNDGLTRHAKKRVQRMMHYDVSLRPFTATVTVKMAPSRSNEKFNRENFDNIDFPTYQGTEGNEKVSPASSASSSPLESPLNMCTPKSFPPTPGSRSLVISKGNRFAEDVVFLARDQLRVEQQLHSENERTRAMSNALKEGSRLAVFNAADVASGIALTCGQHVATKVGNALYCSTRSMVPVLRNCHVYFEMSISSPPVDTSILHGPVASLSIGLSTLEMPLNTLVGAWKGSVGLCTTGQILTAGQWCTPLDPTLSSYGDTSTVGCLVCLDDSSAFQTWDGPMATAFVTFNVNGVVVSPPVCTTPMMAASSNKGESPTLPGSPSQTTSETQQLRSLICPPSTLPLLVPVEEELYPTVTLHSPSTQVMCRFSAEDILASCWESIGAPLAATVHAVDGSILFDGTTNESNDC